MDSVIECIIRCIKCNEKQLQYYNKSQNHTMIEYLSGVNTGLSLSYYFITGKEYEDL